MVFEFLKKKIRYMIDALIIYFVKEFLIILTAHKPYRDVFLYVVLIGVFFQVTFSQGNI
ncbi:hypothetical protein [Caminibacter sp.]